MSQERWWSSRNGLSQSFTWRGEKRDLSDDEEKQWRESFCSESTKKDNSWQSAGSSSQHIEDEPESSSGSSSLHPKEDDSKNDDEEENLKVGKSKKFKYMWFSC